MYTNKIKLLPIAIAILCISSCIDSEKAFPESTPSSNFELLWQLIDEKYCYMEYKNVNWDSIGHVYRKYLKDDMNEVQFFFLCAEMLNELQDGHVNLTSAFNRSRYWNWFLDYPPNFNETILLRNYLDKNYFIVGSLNAKRFNNVGYIRYSSFSNPLSYNGIRNAIAVSGSIEGLIIDVRDNGGGYLSYAEVFASSFIKEDTHVGYTRYKQGPAHNDFTKFFSKTLSAPDTVAFDGPIVVLTNRLVYSSANLFVSFMSELPNVTVMGDITGGGGGIPSSSELHNGWSVRFSTNPLYNSRREHIEWGIEPHIHVNLAKDDEINGIDTILEEAIFLLSGSYYLKNGNEN